MANSSANASKKMGTAKKSSKKKNKKPNKKAGRGHRQTAVVSHASATKPHAYGYATVARATMPAADRAAT